MMCIHRCVHINFNPSRIHDLMPKSTSVPRPCACTTVRRASRVLARVFDTALEPEGLNITQLALLRAVQRHPGEPLMRLAEDLCMDRTSLYRAITPMKRDGWLNISAGADGRSRAAELTRKGLQVLKAADPAWARTQTAIIERFGRAKWLALVGDLERLATCAHDVGSSPSI
jgi:DNA-binding MarR family transcriptional regulator